MYRNVSVALKCAWTSSTLFEARRGPLKTSVPKKTAARSDDISHRMYDAIELFSSFVFYTDYVLVSVEFFSCLCVIYAYINSCRAETGISKKESSCHNNLCDVLCVRSCRETKHFITK